MTYKVFLALHVISVISWMAGILYLIRLFVYHSMETEEIVATRFCLMEQRLYRYITFPAMLSTYLFGGLMLLQRPFLLHLSWLQVKLVLVLMLTVATLFARLVIKEFAQQKNNRTSTFYRIYNEIPTLLMILIVFLVILKVEIY